MDNFDQAQNTIRSAVRTFLPRSLATGAGGQWYHQPVLGRRVSGNPMQTGISPQAPSALQGFLSENTYENLMYKKQAAMMAQAMQSYGAPQDSSGIGSPSGGGWEDINKWDSYVQRAASQTGVPANVIKAIMKIESQGNPNALSSQGYYGLMQTGPDSAVPEYMKSRSWLSDPYNQILAGATELMNKYNAVGRRSWEAAAGAYLGYGVDANGTSTSMYQNLFSQNLNALNSSTRQMGSYGAPNTTFSTGSNGRWVIPKTTNAIIERLKTFVGIDYDLGGKVPGGKNPLDYAGWDCSGLTKWLSDTYGTGELPGGAHYQYQYAQKSGKLFTDLKQLVPGDVIFIKGTFKGGAGAWLNPASHVGVYLGNNQMISAAPGGTAIVSLDHYPNIGKPILGAMHLDKVSGGYQESPGGTGQSSLTYGGAYNTQRGWGSVWGGFGQQPQQQQGYPMGQQGQVWSGGEGSLQTMFGGKFSAPDWGAFGAGSSNGLYGYGTEYGLNGAQHTGLDVPLSIGTPIYAPGNARVICSGTGNGLEGCAAFNDYYGHGAGRIELELANGVRVIYGHSSTSSVRPGQIVSAGTMLGTSGGMNSPHIHLEVRVPDSRYPSGYRLVDPVQFFGGYVGGQPGPGPGGGNLYQAPAPINFGGRGWSVLRNIMGSL